MMAIGMVAVLGASRLSGSTQMVVMVAACIIIYVGMFSNFGLYFSFLTEGGVPLEVSGIAIGVASTFGYLPEVLCPLIAGKTLDVYEGAKGYYIYFTFMLVMAVLGLVLSVIWSRTYGKRYKEKMRLEKEAEGQK